MVMVLWGMKEKSNASSRLPFSGRHKTYWCNPKGKKISKTLESVCPWGRGSMENIILYGGHLNVQLRILGSDISIVTV